MSAIAQQRVVWAAAMLVSLGLHAAALLLPDRFVPEAPAPTADPAPIELMPLTLAAVSAPAVLPVRAEPTLAMPLTAATPPSAAPATPASQAPPTTPAAATTPSAVQPAAQRPSLQVATVQGPAPTAMATAPPRAGQPPTLARLEAARPSEGPRDQPDAAPIAPATPENASRTIPDGATPSDPDRAGHTSSEPGALGRGGASGDRATPTATSRGR
jgi:hypothetical protein